MVAGFIKVFGERNCGTNWLESFFLAQAEAELIHHQGFLLEAVLPAFFGQLDGLPEAQQQMAREAQYDRLFAARGRHFMGWKHAAPRLKALQADARFEACAFVMVVKHPVHFLLSLHRNPYHDLMPPRADLESFLTSPWLTLGRDQLGPVILDGPLDLWQRKARNYLRLAGATPNAALLHYEDLLADFAGHMGEACNSLGIKVRDLAAPQPSSKGDGKDFESYRAQYLGQPPFAKVSPEVAALIRARLDPALMRALGYGAD